MVFRMLHNRETKWLLGTIRETFRSEIPIIQGLTAGLWQDHVT